jgi:hypothetical protein
MTENVTPFRSLGSFFIDRDGKTYWFKDDFAGKVVTPPELVTILEGIAGRKLTTFEFTLAYAVVRNGTKQVTVVGELTSDPSQRNYLRSVRVSLLGYAVKMRVWRVNYGDVNRTEGFYLEEGTLVGERSLGYRQEPPLETPIIDPIDFVAGGLALLIRRAPAIAATKVASRAAPEAIAMLQKSPIRPGLKVLIVGPETQAEFAYARKIMLDGGQVTCVNPVKSPAAERFIAEGGDFFQGEVSKLPGGKQFDIIREDFPFPTGKYIDVAQTSVRINRLRPGGSWVVVTEKADFAATLEAAAAMNKAKVFRRAIPAAHEGAPVSSHPRDIERIALIITR